MKNNTLITCFGELLLRMSPVLNQEWINKAQMPVYIGGAELNVATALAQWSLNTHYVTALPDNFLSKEISQYLTSKNIRTDSIIFKGNKIGTYFIPQGSEMKSAGVIYDRQFSSFYHLTQNDCNWNQIFQHSSWFHCSAIVPSLNENLFKVCLDAFQTASTKNITTSIDLNFRSQFWKYGINPIDIMPQIVQYCDVIMGNIWAADNLLGITSSIADSQHKSQEELVIAAHKTIDTLQKKFPKVKTIALTFRLEKEYFAVISHHKQLAISKTFPLTNIVDKVGSGDCFMAGLIYSITHHNAPQEIINFAAAAAVSKMGIKGDATNKNAQEIKHLFSLS